MKIGLQITKNTDKYKNMFINEGNDKIFYFLFLAAGYEHKNHKVLPGIKQ